MMGVGDGVGVGDAVAVGRTVCVALIVNMDVGVGDAVETIGVQVEEGCTAAT